MLKKHKNKGFSLLELVVAVSILAILSAFLIPSILGLQQESRIQKDNTKFESMCVEFKRALGEPEVKKELEDIVDDSISIVFQIDEEGLINFENGEIKGTQKTETGTAPWTETLNKTDLWLNSCQAIGGTYEADNKEYHNQYLVFNITKKTTTTTAQCSYQILAELP